MLVAAHGETAAGLRQRSDELFADEPFFQTVARIEKNPVRDRWF